MERCTILALDRPLVEKFNFSGEFVRDSNVALAFTGNGNSPLKEIETCLTILVLPLFLCIIYNYFVKK